MYREDLFSPPAPVYTLYICISTVFVKGQALQFSFTLIKLVATNK